MEAQVNLRHPLFSMNCHEENKSVKMLIKVNKCVKLSQNLPKTNNI